MVAIRLIFYINLTVFQVEMTSCNAQRLRGLGITLINYFIPMFDIISYKMYFVYKIL